MCYFSCVEKCKNDIKCTWFNIKDILNKTSRIYYFNINNHCTEDNQIIADSFNIYFTNIGATLANKKQNSGSKTFKSYLDEPPENNFNFTPVTEIAVENIIKQLKGKSSRWADGLLVKLLKSI